MRPTSILKSSHHSAGNSSCRTGGSAFRRFAFGGRFRNRAPWLSLPANSIQNFSDILFEGSAFWPRVTKVEKVYLVLAAKLIEPNPIGMFPKELAKTFFGNPSAACFQPTMFFPSANLPFRYLKEI